MLKLPFRFLLSTVYAKLLFEDLVQVIQSLSAAGWYNLIFFVDPAIQFYRQKQAALIQKNQAQNMHSFLTKELVPDEDTIRIVKEVCVDFKLGEIKVLMWNRQNAGYVFRRVYLPAGWKEWFTEEELKGIVGHELGHLKLGSDAMIPMRIVNRMGDELLFSMLPVHMTGVFILLMSVISQNPAYLKLLSITVLFRLIHLFIENYFSRKDEYKADQYGMKGTSQQTMSSALKKIHLKAKDDLIEQLQHLPEAKRSYYSWLYQKEHGVLREWLLDHPFLSKRLKALGGTR